MSLEPPDQRYSRAANGALVVHEGLPDKWRYTIALEDRQPELSASVTVIFNGKLRCRMRLNRLGHVEADAVNATHIKVLEWIGEYLHRHRTP